MKIAVLDQEKENGIPESKRTSSPRSDSYSFGPFYLNVKERLLLKNGELIHIPPKEMDVLLVLLERRGHLVDKQTFLEEIWPGSFVEEGNLARHVSFLRQRLFTHSQGATFIETVPRRGYRFVDPPQPSMAMRPAEGAVLDHELAYGRFLPGLSFAAKPTVEFALDIKASVQTVWQHFGAIENWPAWSNIYREAQWEEGKTAWEVGSAYTASLREPFEMLLRCVVIDCVPRRRVGWLVYGAGPVLERWVFFQPLRRKTVLRTLASHIGPAAEPLPVETSDCLQQFTRSWYAALRTECERHGDQE
jgi:DNA-binding winged helix-turn-helix (wHTH) protein